MKLVLTSDGISNESIENALIELLGHETSGKRACIVTTASSHKEKSNSAVLIQEWFRKLNFACADFLDIQYDDPRQMIEYDVIYLNGGNPFFLLLWMKRTNAIEIIKHLAEQNKVIVGTSAGAMVLADSIEHVNELNKIAGYESMDLDELENYRAAMVTNIVVVPHYNRFLAANPEFENDLKALEAAANVSFTRVRDGEAVVIHDDQIQLVTPYPERNE